MCKLLVLLLDGNFECPYEDSALHRTACRRVSLENVLRSLLQSQFANAPPVQRFHVEELLVVPRCGKQRAVIDRLNGCSNCRTHFVAMENHEHMAALPLILGVVQQLEALEPKPH